MKRVLLVLLVVLCAASSGCGQSASLSDQDKAAIQKFHDVYVQTWNAQKPDLDALVKTWYAPDAQVVAPNSPASIGHEAVLKTYSAAVPPKNFKLADLAVEGHGDVAFVHGSWEGDWPTPTGGVSHSKGRFLDAMRKQADGSWKLAYNIWNVDTPPAAVSVPTGALKADASGELKTLAWFAGTWQVDIDAKQSPFGPPTKVSMVQECHWLATEQHILCTTEGTATPGGPYHDVTIMGYDAEAKAYKGYDADNTGMMPFALAFKDNQWTFSYDIKVGGKPAKLRTMAFDLTKDGATVKQEVFTGGAWTLIAEGKVHRVGG